MTYDEAVKLLKEAGFQCTMSWTESWQSPTSSRWVIGTWVAGIHIFEQHQNRKPFAREYFPTQYLTTHT